MTPSETMRLSDRGRRGRGLEEDVGEGSVGAEGLLVGAFEGVFGDHVPTIRAGTAAEELFKGETGVSFGSVAVFVRDGQRVVVLFDVRGGLLQRKDTHRQVMPLYDSLSGLRYSWMVRLSSF